VSQEKQSTTTNVQAQHGDVRVEQLKQKYGDMAELTVDELRDRARQQGIKSPSEKNKEELLQELTSGGKGGSGGSGGGGKS
jgi:hypothetical protein